MISRQGGSGARQVDEAAVEKVAQVIYQHSEVTDDGMVCQCGYRSECDLALHQARAVVEFLGERHEPEPESDPLRVRIQQLIDNQQSWIDAGRSGQAISRDAVRDSLQRVLDETEPVAPQPSESDRERLIDVLVMTDMSDYAGTDMGMIRSSADAILAAGFSRAAAPAETDRAMQIAQTLAQGHAFTTVDALSIANAALKLAAAPENARRRSDD